MSKVEVNFVESLYAMSQDELKELYKLLRKNRDELSQKIADILLKYTINDNVMELTKSEANKLYSEISREIKKSGSNAAKLEETIAKQVLTEVVKNVCDYWNYNIKFEDVRAIINANFRGKHFSDRVWEKEREVAKKLHQQVKDFLDGRINVNQIRKELEKTFNTSAYNARRLVETEVARCQDEAFKRFCIETGVKKIKRVATLDKGTCNDCSSDDGTVYELNKAPTLPQHPLCRCYFTVEE